MMQAASKKVYWKQQSVLNSCNITSFKKIFSQLNRCIFQISLEYIKLNIPKILFILVLCNFNFYFKIMWPPPAPSTPPPPNQQNHPWHSVCFLNLVNKKFFHYESLEKEPLESNLFELFTIIVQSNNNFLIKIKIKYSASFEMTNFSHACIYIYMHTLIYK